MLPPLPHGHSHDIPHRLHQIWVGGRPPGWVQTNWGYWDDHLPDPWQIIRWTDDTLGPLRAVSAAARRTGLSHRAEADLIRVAAVSLYGGLYMDSDTLPLRPLDDLVGDRPGWVGSTPRSRGRRMLVNATFGFQAGHPFLADVWLRADAALRRGIRNDHYVAGPMTFRKAATAHPEVETFYTFDAVEDPDVMRAMRRREQPPFDALRERYPDAPVLHVLVNYGNWKGRIT